MAPNLSEEEFSDLVNLAIKKDENIYNCLECISNKIYRNNSIYLNCIKCDEKNIFYNSSEEDYYKNLL